MERDKFTNLRDLVAEGMSAATTPDRLTAVQRMRSELGLRRKDGNGLHGKITSPGIEPIDTFERRMKDRLKEDDGITGVND